MWQCGSALAMVTSCQRQYVERTAVPRQDKSSLLAWFYKTQVFCCGPQFMTNREWGYFLDRNC